jgi:hypothetical protein
MALVRKKTEKKPEAGLVSKGGTALAKVGPEIVVVDPKDKFTKTELREAERLDEKIVKTIARIGKDVIALGEMFEEIQRNGWHRAFLDPETGIPFRRMEDYIRSRGGDLGKSQVFQAMSIVRHLTSGPNPVVSKEDVREMPKDNAESLVRMKKAGVTITPELIQDAKTLPAHRFQTEIENMQPSLAQRNAVERGDHLDVAPEILVPRKFMLSGSVAARLAKAVIVADRLTRGNDPQQSFDDRVIEFIVADFLSEYEAEYEESVGNEIDQAEHNATVYRDSLGPAKSEVVHVVDSTQTEGAEAEAAVAKPFNAPAICKGKTADGAACGSPAWKGTEFCYNHRTQAQVA